MVESSRPVVTISAAYGCGGGFIGPRVADRLGVGFVDRAVSAAVAAEVAARADEVEGFEDVLGRGMTRWLSMFADVAGIWGGISPPDLWFHDTRSYKCHIDDILHRLAEEGAVILGRGAQIVLRDVSQALHVRLDGPVERRIAQAVELGGLDPDAARRGQHHADAARERYIRHLYHRDVADPRFYHLLMDATSLPWATCVEIIVSAVQGRDEFRHLGELGDDPA